MSHLGSGILIKKFDEDSKQLVVVEKAEVFNYVKEKFVKMLSSNKCHNCPNKIKQEKNKQEKKEGDTSKSTTTK